MTNLHPFLAAVQAAHDAHGLPDGVVRVGISADALGGEYRFSVTCGDGATGEHGFAATLPEAYAKAAAKAAANEARRRDTAAKSAARKLLADAGIDPNLIAA